MLKDFVVPMMKDGIKKFGLFRTVRVALKLRKMNGFKDFVKIPEFTYLAEKHLGKRPSDKDSKWYNSFYSGKLPDDKVGKSPDDILFQKALNYLENVGSSKRRKKPFCLFVPIAFPHPPYEVEEPYFSKYDRTKIEPPYPLFFPNPEDREKKPKYAKILHDTYLNR